MNLNVCMKVHGNHIVWYDFISANTLIPVIERTVERDDTEISGEVMTIQVRNASILIIDREAREIMYLVASVRPSVRPFVSLRCLSVCL